MNFRNTHGKSIREAFELFNAENPTIYHLFAQETNKAIKRGCKKISSKMIINWIRWNRYVTTNDPSFKINDAYHAYYSRLFVERNPEHANVFEFRKLRNEVEGQYMQMNENGTVSFF